MKTNTIYMICIFVLSIRISLYNIIANMNMISFWIIYHIIISGITNIELNIIIIDYESLSEQINIIIFFIIILIYFPFVVTYFHVKTIIRVEHQHWFHWSYYIYSLVYVSMIAFIYNHYDFAYSTFMDIIIPNIVQKCIDFPIFFIQYKGYFYDFLIIFVIYRLFIHHFFIFSYNNFYIRSNTIYVNFIKTICLRIIIWFGIVYYFGNNSAYVNFIIIRAALICMEFIYILIRMIAILHMLAIKIVRNPINTLVKIDSVLFAIEARLN